MTSGPLCMRGVRHIIVEEDMDHPLIGRPVLDEMGFVASQHLDSVRDKFHLHDFSHIGEELLEMGKQPLGALVKSSNHARGHSRVYYGLVGCYITGERQESDATEANEVERA
jgi:hypothetical protein